MLDWIITNKEIVKVIYGLAIVLTCIVIVFKTNKLFRISLHQGIRYFRNAFFFYGIAFAIRHFLGPISFYSTTSISHPPIKFIFEFFIIMAGFFLLYSLIWRKFETASTYSTSSLLNKNLIVFYLMTIIIAALDYIYGTYCLMFFSQIFIFILASVISFTNYIEKGTRHKFLKFYFIAMFLSLSAWVLNALAALSFDWNVGIIMNIYIINMIIFLLFLYGVLKLTKKV